jgi:hypothetical protein
MTPARLILLVGMMALVGTTSGCGAAGAGAAKQVAPASAPPPEAAAEEQESAAYQAQSAPGGWAGSTDDEGASEPEAAGEPTSLTEAADEDETIALQTLDGAGEVLSRSLDRLNELLGKPTRKESTAATRQSTDSTGCLEVCKAFSSLERAADAICRLAGDDTRRCKKAREVVAENEPRISACGCDAR